MPTNIEVKGTVRLSSSSVLIGSDSTNAETRDTMKKPKTILQLPLSNPNKKKLGKSIAYICTKISQNKPTRSLTAV